MTPTSLRSPAIELAPRDHRLDRPAVADRAGDDDYARTRRGGTRLECWLSAVDALDVSLQISRGAFYGRIVLLIDPERRDVLPARKLCATCDCFETNVGRLANQRMG